MLSGETALENGLFIGATAWVQGDGQNSSKPTHTYL